MPEMTRSQLLAYAAAAVVIVVLGVRFMQRQGQAATPPSAAAAAQQPGGQADGGSPVRIERTRQRGQLVHVAGAVRRPGVYRVPAGARVQEAIRRAGGARAGADVNAINLAAKVVDGQQVVVPQRVPDAAGGTAGSAAAGGAGAATAAPGGPISLNSATAEQLDTLPGVGPATASKIIEHRTRRGGIRSVEDLAQVPGIGPKRIETLRGLVQP